MIFFSVGDVFGEYLNKEFIFFTYQKAHQHSEPPVTQTKPFFSIISVKKFTAAGASNSVSFKTHMIHDIVALKKTTPCFVYGICFTVAT